MTPRRRVYVAGAYNADNVIDVLANMRRGHELCIKVLRAGFAPFDPWLDYQFGLLADITRDEYLEYSMAWLRASEAVLVVQEGWQDSEGTKAEIREAHGLGIPIFTDLEELKRYFEGRM